MEPDKKTELLALAAIAKSIESELQYADQLTDPSDREAIRARKFSAKEILQREIGIPENSFSPPPSPPSPLAGKEVLNPQKKIGDSGSLEVIGSELLLIRRSLQELVSYIYQGLIKPLEEKKKRSRRKGSKNSQKKNSNKKTLKLLEESLVTEDSNNEGNNTLEEYKEENSYDNSSEQHS